MNSEKMKISVGFALISMIWGSTWLVIKIGLESVPPLFAVAIRFTLATVILCIILKLKGERMPMHRNAVILYFTLAFMSYGFPFALVYWGEQFIPSGLASILFAVYPFVVAIGSHIALPDEKLNLLKVVGILFGFAGVTMIFWADIRWGEASTLAMLGILASTIMQGTSLIVVKRMSKDITPTALSLGGMMIGIVVLYCLALVFEDYHAIRFDLRGAGSILYLGTFGTVVTFLTYYWLLKRIEAVYLSLVTLVTPVLAVFLGAIVLGEKLQPNVFSGASVIFIGILITNGRDVAAAVQRHKARVMNYMS